MNLWLLSSVLEYPQLLSLQIFCFILLFPSIQYSSYVSLFHCILSHILLCFALFVCRVGKGRKVWGVTVILGYFLSILSSVISTVLYLSIEFLLLSVKFSSFRIFIWFSVLSFSLNILRVILNKADKTSLSGFLRS